MFPFRLFVFLVFVTQTSSSPKPERQTIGLLKGSAGEFALECEYEVSSYQDPKYSKPPPRSPDGAVALDSGRVRYQTDPSYRLEIVHQNLNRNTVKSIWKSGQSGKITTYIKDRDGKFGEATIISGKDGLSLPWASFFDIFRLPQIIEELESPHAEASWGGEEFLDGCHCRILKIRHFKNQPADRGATSVYWLDLSKNGLVLRRDYFHGTNLVRRLNITKFQRFIGLDKTVWLPIDACEYGFLTTDSDGKTICLENPTGRMVYRVMTQSVQIYQKLDVSRFALTFPPGTTVKDLITKKTYEVGQDRRPPPKSDAETKQRLIEYLAQADTQAKEVRAPSLERGDVGASTLSVVSWVLGGISAVTLVFLSIKRIRNG